MTDTERTEMREAVIQVVRQELERATRLHGPFPSAHHGYAVILEELDELKDEVWQRTPCTAIMYREASHVAAMACRFMLDICLGGGR